MRLWDDAKALRRVTLWLYTLVVVSVCVAGFKWLWDSAYFPIKNVHFYGELKETNLNHLADVAQKNIHGNFFKADMNQLKQALTQDAWVESIRVQRLWPDTVNVFVVERQAKARWSGGGLVDAKGITFNAKTAQNLPEYEGPRHMMPKLVRFQEATSPWLQQQQLQMKQLSVSERGAWTLVLSNDVVVKLGRRDLEPRLQRFLRYWQRDLAPLGSGLEYVDLRYHDGFAIKQHAMATQNLKTDAQQQPLPAPTGEVVEMTENELEIN